MSEPQLRGRQQAFLPRFEAGYEPEPNSGCWIWLRRLTPKGYGRIQLGGSEVYVHRAAWEFFRGPIPETLEVDHLCGMRCCVNPDHLEPVTHAENVRRSASGEVLRAMMLSKPACPNGHSYAGAPLDANGHRICLICRKAHWKRRNARQGAKRRLARCSG